MNILIRRFRNVLCLKEKNLPMLSKYSITSVRPFNAANIRDVLPARKRESNKKKVSTCFFVNENKKTKKTNDKIVRYENKGAVLNNSHLFLLLYVG